MRTDTNVRMLIAQTYYFDEGDVILYYSNKQVKKALVLEKVITGNSCTITVKPLSKWRVIRNIQVDYYTIKNWFRDL